MNIVTGNGFLLSSELQECSLAGLLGNQCTSRFLPARIPVDAEWRSSYRQSRDDCVGVTVDKVRCPHAFYGGEGQDMHLMKAGERGPQPRVFLA